MNFVLQFPDLKANPIIRASGAQVSVESRAEVFLNGQNGDRFDLLEALQDPKWTGRVHRSHGVQYEYHVSNRHSPVLRPTSSSRGYAGITLSRTPIPVTYMGTQNSVVRFDTWDFSVYRSFEIDFRTFEPNGVLFFV
ncbi:unnamed protein product [Schistocephalus solidus]|uniref:Arabinofuranosidase n=1 Tax=Schistocephalus solidus TaxID=70667 RepID=A0A183SBF6_SCHSO|nr:unnamed protein product [Schistocephalus solidus]